MEIIYSICDVSPDHASRLIKVGFVYLYVFSHGDYWYQVPHSVRCSILHLLRNGVRHLPGYGLLREGPPETTARHGHPYHSLLLLLVVSIFLSYQDKLCKTNKTTLHTVIMWFYLQDTLRISSMAGFSGENRRGHRNLKENS